MAGLSGDGIAVNSTVIQLGRFHIFKDVEAPTEQLMKQNEKLES